MLRWCDGFDHYAADFQADGSPWSVIGSAVDVVDTLPNNGDHHLEISANPDDDGMMWRSLTSLPCGLTGPIGVGHAVYLPAYPDDGYVVLAAFSDTASLIDDGWTLMVVADTAGRMQVIRVVDSAETVLGQSKPCVAPAGSYFYFECKVFFDASEGAVEIRLNELPALTVAGVDTRSGFLQALPLLYGLGAYGAAVPAVYFDDTFFWDDSGALNNDFLGPCRVWTLFPSGDTVQADWTVQGAGTGYQAILTSDGDTSYIVADAPAVSEFLFDMLALDDEQILAVTALAMMKGTGAGNSEKLHQGQSCITYDGSFVSAVDACFDSFEDALNDLFSQAFTDGIKPPSIVWADTGAFVLELHGGDDWHWIGEGSVEDAIDHFDNFVDALFYLLANWSGVGCFNGGDSPTKRNCVFDPDVQVERVDPPGILWRNIVGEIQFSRFSIVYIGPASCWTPWIPLSLADFEGDPPTPPIDTRDYWLRPTIACGVIIDPSFQLPLNCGVLFSDGINSAVITYSECCGVQPGPVAESDLSGSPSGISVSVEFGFTVPLDGSPAMEATVSADPIVLGPDYARYQSVIEVDPSTGLPWTDDTLNTSRLRVSMSAEQVSPAIVHDERVTQAVVLVLAREMTPCFTHWAQCWRIERRDGEVFRFTSHDRPLTIQCESYGPCYSLAASASELGTLLGAPGNVELAGIVADAAITEADLYAGLFDRARVEIWLVPWDIENPVPRLLTQGVAGNLSQGDEGFAMEVLTRGAQLQQRPLLQFFTPGCRWELGDSRCTVDLDALAVTGDVTQLPVLHAATRAHHRTFWDSSRAEADGYFDLGVLEWTSGANTGQISEIKTFAGGQFVLWRPTISAIAIGDEYEARPGCDKQPETCKTKFNNFVNYGGFPDVPGRDAIVQTPDSK